MKKTKSKRIRPH